jgi:TIR domain
MGNHVFVSHSHQDLPAAELLVNALEERGVSCWVAPRDVPAGGSYAEALLNAIESANCFVLIYSQHSNVSSHVLREVERALKFGLNIVPLRFDESTPSKSLDYLLATVHWLSIVPDARDRSIVKAVEQIVACVANSKVASPAALPARVAPASIAAGPIAAIPASPHRPRSRRSALIGGAVLLAIVAGLIWFLAARNRAGGEGAKVDQNELPQPVTHRYFAFLANHKLSGAYNLLSMAFRKHVRIGNFSKNVGAKPPVRLIEAPIVSQSEHNASIAAVLEDTDPAANKARWKVPIELVLEGSVWRIDSMNGFSPWSGRPKSDAANESADEAAQDPPKPNP